MRVDYKKMITQYITEQNYEAIVEVGRENNARALRYVQMNIWGDYRNPQRWYAVSALEALAGAYAADHDEIYRNVIRRAVWAMADESGNVPWAAPEMMTAVIKACPQQYKEFVKIMITNGLDSPMCHLGVLWSIGYLGPDYLPEMEPFMKRILKFLDHKDGELRGTAVWALKRLQYEPAFAKINSMADDEAEVWIYDQGCLQQQTISQIVKKVDAIVAEEKTLAFLHWEKLVQNKDFKQADKFYEKMKQEQQLEVEVCFVMGLWYRQMEQYGRSADAFVQGLMLKPDSSDLYYELGNTMREMGSDEGAERYYRNCLALRPHYIDALFCLGQVLAAQEKTKEAADSFCKALNLCDSVQEMIAIAVELSAIGLADQAIHVYFLGLLQEPENYYLYSNLGIELAEQGDFDDAVFCHEKALQMDGENADLWYNAACTYSLMGEAMRGLLALEKSIELDDSNRDYAQQDPEMEFLQKHKRFWKLVKRNENL